MISSKTLLVPMDFSECSTVNLQNAVDLAKTFKAKLIILHVISSDNSIARFCYNNRSQTDIENELYKNAMDSFKRMEELVDELKYVEHEFKIRKGVAYREILKEIEESKIDVLVIGAKGESELDDFIYGSVTEKVIKKSPVTTIITRKNQDKE
jgi:nucleotide-binding universal stress UspA family protein